MRIWILNLILILSAFLYANDNNLTINLEKIKNINNELSQIESELNNNIWITRYSNYLSYQKLYKELKDIEHKIWKAKKYRKYRKNLPNLIEQKKILNSQILVLKDFKESPFDELLKTEKLSNPPSVTNPIEIVAAFTYIKKITSKKKHYKEMLNNLKNVLNLLKKKRELLHEKYNILKSKKIKDNLDKLDSMIKDFEIAVKTGEKTTKVYNQRVKEIVFKVTEDIKEQTQKAITVFALILIFFIISLSIKWGIRKYIKDSERYYMANKAINFTFATIVILTLLFAYMENISYIVTILGFASAGIAIAMKDMFMSMLGWMVIVFGGSIHVGDRIKVKKNGVVYVGDVVDISMLRMTILEDVTLTSYLENIRSGRVIFVPNNYIFTDLIANYTHAGLKTVWDGIYINITFDSNYKKAVHIAKEIARKYAKGYTDIARKQLNRLRSSYHLKTTNVDVRVHPFVEEYGIKITVWYMTNSYATLTLRSTISTEILNAYLQEDDITLAYPTQTIALTKDKKTIINSPKNIEGEA